MRVAYRRKLIFIGKSIVWSVILYLSVIAILDWDDIKNQKKVIAVETENTSLKPAHIDASIHYTSKKAITVLGIFNKIRNTIVTSF